MEKVKAVAEGAQMLMNRPAPPLLSTSFASPSSWSAPASGALPEATAATTATTAPAAAPTWTPMTPPASTPAPTPAPVAVDLPAVLDGLVDTVDGVRAVVLASVDGFGIAHSRSTPDEASHPAMLAAAIGLAHQLVSMGGGTTLRQLVVDHDGGLMLVWPLGDERVLAVLTTTAVEQRLVRSYVQAQSAHLTGAAA